MPKEDREKSSKERLELEKEKNIFECLADPVIRISVKGTILSFNAAAQKLTGYTLQDVLDKDVTFIIPNLTLKKISVFLSRTKTSQSTAISVDERITVKTKFQQSIPVQLSLSEMNLFEQTSYVCIFHDISRIKAVFDKLKESEEVSKAVLNTAIDGIITVNAQGDIQSINPAALGIFQYTQKEMVGTNISKLMPALFSEQKSEDIDRYGNTAIKDKLGRDKEVDCLKKNGETFPGRISVSEFSIDDETYFTVMIRDVSHIKIAEEQTKKADLILSKQAWIRTGQIQIQEKLRGDINVSDFYSIAVGELARLTSAITAALYVVEHEELIFKTGFAYPSEIKKKLKFNEGLVGRAADEKKMIKICGEDSEHMALNTTTANFYPKEVIAIPLKAGMDLVGVMEFSYQSKVESKVEELLSIAMESVGVLLNSALNRKKIIDLLAATQLQEQELMASNEELEQKSTELLSQQRELEIVNNELQQQSKILGRQKENLEEVNRDLVELKGELEKKAKDLEISGQYKSEFLANMSHELRTPLNSIMILSKLLSEDSNKNMTEDQKENARIIFDSAEDLHKLINDILDLSKIEAGKLEIVTEEIDTKKLAHSLESSFSAQAKSKSVEYKVVVTNDAPRKIVSDNLRLEQVLNNFISNALKFTSVGSVEVLIDKIGDRAQHLQGDFDPDKDLAVEVIDTGIGIPKDKLEIIFQAFQQVDGTITRKYGGTGLGLSITRVLSELLGGEILVESEVDRGSKFTFCISENKAKKSGVAASPPLRGSENLEMDDSDFCTGLKGKVTELRDLDEVVNNVVEESAEQEKSILVVEDNDSQRQAIVNLLSTISKNVTGAATAKDAIDILKMKHIDCMILDLNLPDISGLEFLQTFHSTNSEIYIPPVIVYTGKELDHNEKRLLNECSRSVIIKGSRSPDRLLNEVAQFLSEAVEKDMSYSFSDDEIFTGKKILIVDDDVRNSYSIKQILQGRGLEMLIAFNGVESLEIVNNNSDIDLILMDIMMPEMDGYEAMKEIRKIRSHKNLPIIAVTAKAMKSDRESCLNAGANDYIVKPVDPDKLLSVMRVWLSSDTYIKP